MVILLKFEALVMLMLKESLVEARVPTWVPIASIGIMFPWL